MHKTIIQLVIAILLISTGFSSAQTTNLSPKEILEESDYARGNIEGIKWIIHIESIEKNRKQTRSLKVSARGANSLAEMIAPSRVKGRKLLMLDRNMWFIKPGLRKPVPISPRQKLLGGASNGDIASTNYAGDYTIADITEDKIGQEPCYCYDLVAAKKNATYDRIRYWVSKKRHVGVKSDFFTTSGKLYKSATFEYNHSITIGNRQLPFVSRMVIRNAIVKNDVTVMSYHDIKIKKIPDATFNLNLLMQ